MALTPAELVQGHLNLDETAMKALRRGTRTVVREIIVLCAALWVTIARVDEKKAEELVAAPLRSVPAPTLSGGNVDVGFAFSTRLSKD
jgi:hypothetical protein